MIVYPPIHDIDKTITQVRHEIVYEINTSSTCLNLYYFFQNNDLLSFVDKDVLFSTGVKLESINDKDTSTWEEVIMDNFDLFSKVVYRNNYKIKSRIKTISKYIPNITIE